MEFKNKSIAFFDALSIASLPGIPKFDVYPFEDEWNVLECVYSRLISSWICWISWVFTVKIIYLFLRMWVVGINALFNHKHFCYRNIFQGWN